MAKVNEENIMQEWNEYCDSINNIESQIYPMEALNEILGLKDPYEIINMVYFGEFNPMDEYFSFNGYGNLISGQPSDLADLEDPAFMGWLEKNYCPLF